MKILILTFITLVLVSCAKKEVRKPSSVEPGKSDLIENAKVIQENISNGKISSENCLASFDEIQKKYYFAVTLNDAKYEKCACFWQDLNLQPSLIT